MGLFQKLFEIEKRDNWKDIHEKSQNRRENHLGVVVNRNFLGRGAEVGKISEIFGFNQNYVSQMFKKSEQEGFTAYLTQVRMGHAIQLLRESDCQIREVGERCGYADYFYFARVFKKYIGRSPGEYRGETRGNEGEES